MTAAERVARFSAQISRGDGCWLWQGAVTPDGYGRVRRGYRPDGRVLQDYAHRVAYWLTYGPIPDGAVVRHSCDNPPCCNPEHLLIGSQGDNLRDAFDRGRMPEQRPGRWTVPADVRAAVIAAPRGAVAAIARRTGFSLQVLAAIRRRALAKAAAHV